MKAITQLISPIGGGPQEALTSSQLRGNLSATLTHGEGTDSPKMHQNRAYDYLPPHVQPAVTSPETKQLSTVPDSAYYVIESVPVDSPEKAVLRDELKPRSASQESDPGYDYIKDTVPEPMPAYSPPSSILHGNTDSNSTPIAKLNPKLVSTHSVREEGYTLMQSAGCLRPTSSDPSLPSPESPMDVPKTLKRLSRFNSDQMGHLIDMLRMTIATQPHGPIPEQAAMLVTTPPPRPPKPTQTISKVSDSSSLTKSRERPSQLSLSTSESDSVHLYGSHEYSVYVNSISLAGEEESGKSGEKETEGVSVPTLIVEPTDEESAPPVQRKKSVGLLNTAATANAIKFKLGEAIAIILNNNSYIITTI